jgi:hypothetical protein
MNLNRGETMYTDFINNKLDHSNTEARTLLSKLWDAYIEQATGRTAVRMACRRSFEAAIREAGWPVGTVGNQKFVGGLALSGMAKRPRRRWTITAEGHMKLTLVDAAGSGLARERGQSEAAVPAGFRSPLTESI